MARPKGGAKETAGTSLRLTPLCKELWTRLAERAGLNRTAYLEMMIRRLAKEEGVTGREEDKASDTPA